MTDHIVHNQTSGPFPLRLRSGSVVLAARGKISVADENLGTAEVAAAVRAGHIRIRAAKAPPVAATLAPTPPAEVPTAPVAPLPVEAPDAPSDAPSEPAPAPRRTRRPTE